MQFRCFIVDAFSDRAGAGNPAAVVLHNGELDSGSMQAIAFEMGRSETAFVRAVDEARGRFEIRWFSPLDEMPLCGHATLAAAKVIYSEHDYPSLSFDSPVAGPLSVVKAAGGFLSMRFPLDEYRRITPDPAIIGFFGLDGYEDCIVGESTKKVILVVAEAVDIAAIRPDFGAMSRYSGICSKGIAITKRSRAYDFESRYFNPWCGVNEDPVTGSVHTVLARYWGDALGKRAMTAFQNSHRPGTIGLKLGGGSVDLEGKATIFLRGLLDAGGFEPGAREAAAGSARPPTRS